jgi:hypothetical protein
MLAYIGLLWELHKLFHARKTINVRFAYQERTLCRTHVYICSFGRSYQRSSPSNVVQTRLKASR